MFYIYFLNLFQALFSGNYGDPFLKLILSWETITLITLLTLLTSFTICLLKDISRSHRIFTRRQLTMVRSTAIPSSLFTHHLFRIPLGLPLYSWYPVRNVSTYRRKETRKTYKTTRWKYSRETVIRFFMKRTLG